MSIFIERNGSIELSQPARVACAALAFTAVHTHHVYQTAADLAVRAIDRTTTAAGQATDATIDYLADKIYNATTNVTNQFSSQNINQRCEYLQRKVAAPTAAVAAQAATVASSAAVLSLFSSALLAAAPVTFCVSAVTAWCFRSSIMAQAGAGITAVGERTSQAVIRPIDERREAIPPVKAEVPSELPGDDSYLDLYS